MKARNDLIESFATRRLNSWIGVLSSFGPDLFEQSLTSGLIRLIPELKVGCHERLDLTADPAVSCHEKLSL